MQPTDSNSSGSIYSAVFQNGGPTEPVLIIGNGHVTLFGLNYNFSTKIPPRLRARLAQEEFEVTILLINRLLQKHFINNIFWFFCGCITFCCTLGCSMCPTLYFNKRTLRSIRKTLKSENNRLYHKLGMHWSLHRKHSGPFNLAEYVIDISFLPKPDIYVPD